MNTHFVNGGLVQKLQPNLTMFVRSPVLLAIAFVALVVAPDAFAGSGGAAFDDVWIWITDNIQGTLGRIIIGLMITVGIAAGVANQSLISFVIGVGGGIGLYNTPTVLETLISGTVVHVDKAASVAPMLANGL